MSANIQKSENHKDICKFENCYRIGNYRRLKVSNWHLQKTNYEFCAYHKPKNSINKNFLIKQFLINKRLELKYYNQTNEHIISEYYNYIINLFKNHKFGFPIKYNSIYRELVI